MIKKIILTTVFVSALLFIIPWLSTPANAEVIFGYNDDGAFIEIHTIFSDYINEFINSSPQVLDMYIDRNNSITFIFVTDEFWEEMQQGNAFTTYLNQLEFINERNKAQVVLYPDNQPAPLCVRDVVTGESNGIYSINSELFLLPHDPRCPN